MEGWNRRKVYSALEACEEISTLAYELKNCVRGCYTGATTYAELSEYIKRLAANLESAAVEISYEKEDPVEEDD